MGEIGSSAESAEGPRPLQDGRKETRQPHGDGNPRLIGLNAMGKRIVESMGEGMRMHGNGKGERRGVVKGYAKGTCKRVRVRGMVRVVLSPGDIKVGSCIVDLTVGVRSKRRSD